MPLMEDGQAVEADVVALTTLGLGDKKTLTIGEKDVVFYDPDNQKMKKLASGSLTYVNNAKLSLPLYNVLWAEITNGKLVIDYASQISKSSLKVEKWTFAVPTSSSETDGSQTFTSTLLSRAYGASKLQKRAYVLINPNSGPGGALRKWQKDVKPLLDAARMELDVVTLTRGGEATDLVEKCDIDRYDTIMACSGDGTPHEIFNGLAKRPDAKKAMATVAVSHIPCGSGNALSLNLYGTHRAALAALAIVKGVVMPLDLVSISQGDRRIVSFLSQSLGMIAESDLGTENLRWMGGARFDVGMMMRIFRRRCYPCDLAVKVEIDDKEKIKKNYKRLIQNRSLAAPVTNGIAIEADESEGLPALKYGTIKDDIPEGWEKISYDKIGNFYCGNLAYMAADTNFFPAAMASDGRMDLVTVNGDISPIVATKMLLGVENGSFFDSPHVEYKKISAYRIIPRNQADGYISIDGERVPFEPFQAEIHQGLGRAISKRGVLEADGPINWEKVTLG